MSRFRKPSPPATPDALAAIIATAAGMPVDEARALIAAPPAAPAATRAPAIVNRPAPRDDDDAGDARGIFDSVIEQARAAQARREQSAELAARRAARRADRLKRAALALTALAIVSRPQRRTKARASFLGLVQERPGCERFAPESWSDQDFALTRWAFPDRSGTRVVALLEELPERLRRAVVTAALDTHLWDGEWTTVRTFRSHVARRRALIAILIWRLGRASTRRGMARVLEGYARGTWAALFPDPASGEQPTKRTIDEDLRALRAAGAIYVEQPPAHRARPEYVGRDREGRRRALAVFYVPARMACAARRDDPRDDHERADHVAALLRLDAPPRYARTRFPRRQSHAPPLAA